MTIAGRRRGPVPRFSREQLVDAAVGIVETQGFAALSLRSVARELGVGPMTLYTYVESSNELASLVVDRLVDDAVAEVRWSTSWRAVLRMFGEVLADLVVTHPAMVEAYQQGMLSSGRAAQVSRDVTERLIADGLTPQQATEAYFGVHALVLGFALMRASQQQAHDAAAAQQAPVPPRPPDELRLDGALLSTLVDRLLDGLAR
jgi:AcrR family transcriptional regulator